jgi:hypothetical protein
MFETYPYLIHTNRELGLMLAGKKPLATFFDAEGYWPDVLQRYIRMFDRHIANGTLVRRDHFIYPTSNDKRKWHRVLFALPAEEWRIDAMIELMSGDTWSAERERREGELLGYEDWMNDFHLARRSEI